MDRRGFLTGTLGAGSVGAALAVAPGLWPVVRSQQAVPGAGPYGSIDRQEAGPLGLLLPEGFTARVLATSDEAVADTGHTWHPFPDGGATFADADGWIYVSNSESPAPGGGGVSALRFDADGGVVDAYPILEGTSFNCAGGPTPWGTWLSCEEFDWHDNPDASAAYGSVAGQVWETDPSGGTEARVLPALGLFQHEAAAVDPVGERLYLTEDKPDGRLYRFTPDAYPDLSSGVLEVAAVEGGTARWLEVPDPSATQQPTRSQVGASSAFDGGEGIWYHDGAVYFTTKGDDRVHELRTDDDAYRIVYDAEAIGGEAPLRGVDNITVEEGSGDLYVAEDGGSMQVVLITPDGEVAPFLRILGQDDSEITGPAFSPDGTRLYFSSQRGSDGRGITYEVTGPFRGVEMAAAGATDTTAPGTTLEEAAGGAAGRDEGGNDDGGVPAPLVAGGVIAAAVGLGAAGMAGLRNRRSGTA